jgi:hypothetical protein
VQPPGGMIGNTRQHVGEPGSRIDIVEPCRGDERIHRRSPAAIGGGLIMPWFRSQNSPSDIHSIR